MKKILMRVLKIVLIVVIVLFVAKTFFLGTIVEIGAKGVLGTDVKVGSFKLGILNQKIRIKDFRIMHPKGYEEGVMVDIPEISVDYNLFAMLTGKLHLPLVVLNLKEMVVIKNKEGELNVDQLKVVKNSAEESEQKTEKKKSKEMAMQIDRLVLTVGKVVSKSYESGDKPIVTAFDVGIKDKEYKNIKSAEQLSLLLMSTAMGPTALKGAAIYGAATVLGVAFLPAGIAGILISKDSVAEEFNLNFDELFKKVVGVVKELGDIKSQDEKSYTIKAKIKGADVAVKIEKGENKQSKLTISARKYMIPKKTIAEGVMYELNNSLK